MLFDFKYIIDKHNIRLKGVIHIGAHFGLEDNLYREANASYVVYFEPHPVSFAKLKRSLKKKPNTALVNKALGPQKGIVQMHCSNKNAGMSNSLLKPQDHATIYPEIVFDYVVNVKMNTLDREMIKFSEDIKRSFNCIVIDVQGFELEVFKGSKETLNQIECIFTEANFRYMYESCALIAELDEFLSPFGFIRVETFDTGEGWGDALYIKKDHK
jgi:FkbM family methyltransferase